MQPSPINVEFLENAWLTFDGVRIAARTWSVSAPRGAVLITHGLGDHSGRFEQMAEMFCAAGLGVVSPDLRGHGRSGGQRGFVRKFDDFLCDLDQSVEETCRRFPGLPLFGYGQSFGGLLVLVHALRRRPRLAGLVVGSPAIRIAMPAPPWKVAAGRIASVLFPRLSLGTQLDLGELSDNPEHESRARADELLHGRITPRTFFGMLDAGRYCLEHAGELSIPALIMHGGRDTITDPVATRAFAQKAPGCTLQEWPAGKHELHQMSCGKEIIAVASDWIVARCPVSTADNDKQASIARPGN